MCTNLARALGRVSSAVVLCATVLLGLGSSAPAHADHGRPHVAVVVGFPPIVLPAPPVVVVRGAPAYDDYEYDERSYCGDRDDSDSDSDDRHHRHCHH